MVNSFIHSFRFVEYGVDLGVFEKSCSSSALQSRETHRGDSQVIK